MLPEINYTSIYKNKILCVTSGFFLLSFLFYLVYSKKNRYENILSAWILITFITSILFWRNPVRNSTIHKIDSIVARIAILLFIPYTIFFKQLSLVFLLTYLLFLFLAFITINLSDKASSKEWCGKDHIFYHGLFHLSCSVGALYTFL